MEWFDTVIGAVIAYTAYRVGVSRERSRGRPVDDKTPICGCNHHYSYHDENGCNADDGHTEHWSYKHGRYVSDKCKCKKYTGPEPLPDFFA